MSGGHAPVVFCDERWGMWCDESHDGSGQHRCMFQRGHVKRCQCVCWQRRSVTSAT